MTAPAPLSDTTLIVSFGAPGWSFTARHELDTGAGTATFHGRSDGKPASARQCVARDLTLAPIDASELGVFREFAAKMRERGVHRHRDQFATAGVSFTLESDVHAPIIWDFEFEGGSPQEGRNVFERSREQVLTACRKQEKEENDRPPLLPPITNDEELMPLHRQTEPWIAATEEVARKHRLGDGPWERAGDGSHIVMLGADSVIKFYVPHWDFAVDAEEAAMELVRAKVPFDVPWVRARGVLDGWDYLAVSRIQGTPLRDVELSDDEALQLAESLGSAIRSLHDIDVPEGSPIRAVVPSWRAFVSDLRDRRRVLEVERGTPEIWADRLVEHLKDWEFGDRPIDMLLHADLTHDHIMLHRVDGAWEFRGLVDFGDVKGGDPAYDFAAPFAFWTADRPELRKAMLEGYGTADEKLLDRIFESLLLHEFGRLSSLDLDGLESIGEVRRRYVDID